MGDGKELHTAIKFSTTYQHSFLARSVRSLRAAVASSGNFPRASVARREFVLRGSLKFDGCRLAPRPVARCR